MRIKINVQTVYDCILKQIAAALAEIFKFTNLKSHFRFSFARWKSPEAMRRGKRSQTRTGPGMKWDREHFS